MTELDPEVIELRRAARALLREEPRPRLFKNGVIWERLRKAIEAVRALEKST